jgi:serine phosphatase RsbU (regulator of sigma subunit)/ligand-binding sensor domain-containing protein/DNA-binding CsgD family transcriptional regulator
MRTFGQNYSETVYTTKDGLKSNDIKDLIQTKDGHLWMINAGELCKFDGKDFTYYPLKNDIKSDWENIELTELNSGEIMLRSTEFAKFNPKTESFIYYIDPPIEATTVYDGNGNSKGLTPPNHAPFDKNGNVWHTSAMGVYKVFEDKCIRLPTDSSLKLSKLFVGSKDNRGNVWAQVNQYSVSQLSDTGLFNPEFVKFGFDSFTFIPQIKFIDTNKNIVFINSFADYDDNQNIKLTDKNLYYLNIQSNKLDTILIPEERVIASINERNNKLYILTYSTHAKHLYIYNVNNNSSKEIIIKEPYFKMHLTQRGKILLYNLTHRTLQKINSFSILTQDNKVIQVDFDNKFVRKIISDQRDNFWMACNDGLYTYNHVQINYAPISITAPLNKPYDLNNGVFTSDNSFWCQIGKDYFDYWGNIKVQNKKHLCKYNVKSQKLDTILTSLEDFDLSWDNIRNTLWIENERQFWQTKNGFISKVDIEPPSVDGLNYSIINGKYYANKYYDQTFLLEDGVFEFLHGNSNLNKDINENLPLLINNQSIFIYDEKAKKTKLLLTLNKGEHCKSIEQDSKKNYWTFTFKNQIIYYSSPALTLKKEKVYQNSGARNSDIKTAADKSGNVWLTSNMGLNFLTIDADTIKSVLISKKEGLSSTIINDLYVDEHNFLWVATDNGVDRLNVNSFVKNGTVDIEHFGKKEGLKDVNCTKFVIRNKQIMAFTNSGYAVIDTSIQLTTLDAPNPYFTNLGYSVDGELNEQKLDSRLREEGVKFDNPFGPVYIGYNAIKFNNTKPLQYTTLLYKGNNLLYGSFDNINWTENEEVKYEGLAPGNYKIEVYCRVGAKGVQSEPTILEFAIVPAWWQTWWAKGLAILLIVLGLYLLYKQRTKALLKRQKQLEETVKEKTAEVVVQKNEAENQRDVAHEQKLIAEEKTNEILDSLNYAKRLQEAILPSPRLVKEWLTESFIFYKPKDIVAGDFYWMESVAPTGKNEKQLILFAAADCTGHGVPGAMVSVVCANALNRSVKEFGLTDPGKILDKVSELVVEAFEKSEDEIKDGMDIALCALDMSSKTLYYSGANNALYRITKRIKGEEIPLKTSVTETHKLIEYKATKRPIGSHFDDTKFATQEIKLEPGDSIYLFSDGFADQFGGAKGKKLKYKPFRELLLENHEKPMETQKTILSTAFDSWKGTMEQIDDVCIIGVKVNGVERNNFTDSELKVLACLKEGLSSKLIADKLNLSKNTVDTYRRRLLAKTGTYNATELINYCVKKEII